MLRFLLVSRALALKKAPALKTGAKFRRYFTRLRDGNDWSL